VTLIPPRFGPFSIRPVCGSSGQVASRNAAAAPEHMGE
jgi:hypothetical protein